MEPIQVGTSLPPPAPGLVLSQFDILSTASSIIQTYPSVTSAYLYGSYAKGTAHSDSDINIVLFTLDPILDNRDIGGLLIELDRALNRVVNASLCPSDDDLKWIKKYWVRIHPHCCKPSDSSSSDEIKERLLDMEQVCRDLIKFIDHANSTGGVRNLDTPNLYEPAICNCVNRLGYSIKSRELGFDAELQKVWTDLRAITGDYSHKCDLSKVWNDLPMATKSLLVTIEAKLKDSRNDVTNDNFNFIALLKYFLFQLINIFNINFCRKHNTGTNM